MGQLQPKRRDCEAHDLEMLSEWDPDRADVRRFHCAYYLGQPLSYDLLVGMGAETFTSSLREYYRLSLEVQEEDRTPGMAEVRKAFAGQDAIIDYHWSGKLNAPENRPFDEGYERTSHDLIRWEQYPTFAGGVVKFKGVLLGDSTLVSRDATEISRFEFAAFKLRSVDGGADLGSILPPPREGKKWILDDPGDVQAANFAINEAERRFQFDSSSQPPWVRPGRLRCACVGLSERRQGVRLDGCNYLAERPRICPRGGRQRPPRTVPARPKPRGKGRSAAAQSGAALTQVKG